MIGIELPEETSLLALTFTQYMDWKPYSPLLRLLEGKWAPFIRAQHFLSPESILYLYKSTIRPCMEYCSHICGGALRSQGLDLLDRVQKRVLNLLGYELSAGSHTLSHRRNVASLCLFYKYYNHECSFQLPKCRTKYYNSSFFTRTAALRNSLPNECFPSDYDLTAFKGRVNKFLLLQ